MLLNNAVIILQTNVITIIRKMFHIATIETMLQTCCRDVATMQQTNINHVTNTMQAHKMHVPMTIQGHPKYHVVYTLIPTQMFVSTYTVYTIPRMPFYQ